MTNRLPAVVLFVAAAVVAVEGAKTKVQKDPKFDFTTLKTWAWSPGAGDVKIWVHKDSKSEPVKRQYEPVLMQAVEEQFLARGYARATSAPPDFVLTYLVVVTIGDSSHYAGQFLPANANFGIPPFAPQTTALEIYPQGTLVLDVAKPESKDMIWRGMAEAKIELENNDAKRAARLRTIIKELVSKFPQSKKQ